jgi:oligosaccharide repeat unit polymerase
MLLLLAALALSLVTFVIPRTGMLRVAVFGSAAIGAGLLLRDALVMWRHGGVVGRLTLNLGMFYWFWLGAVGMALSDPAFRSPDVLYPGFRALVPDRVVSIGLVCANLFALTTLLGWRFVPQPRRMLRRLADRIDPRSSRWLDLLAFGMASLAWVPIMVAYEGELRTAFHDLLLMRTEGQIGPTQSVGLEHHLRLIGLFGGAFSVARIVFHAHGIRWLRYLSVAISIPIAFFGDSSRFNFGFMILPALLILGAPLSHQIDWKNRRRVLVVLLIATVVLVLYQGAVRTTGLGGGNASSLPLTQTLGAGYVGHDQFGPMLIAIDLVDAEGHFFMEPMAPFFITHFIPRAIWPGKPDPVSWETYNAAWTQGGTFNVTPSITGQYYLNWGYFGVAYIGLFMGWLARFCEQWFRRLDVARQLLSATVAGLLLAFVFFSFRFFHPLYFAYPLFGYITYRLVTHRQPPAAAQAHT